MQNDLVKVFHEHDPMELGVKENNLLDEYDSEIELLIENIENIEDGNVRELLEFIFDEMFGMVPELSEAFVSEVKAIIL
jgi:hypothetical protein